MFCEADRISQNRCRQGLRRLRKFLPSFPQEKKSFPSYAAYEKTTFTEYLTNDTLNM